MKMRYIFASVLPWLGLFGITAGLLAVIAPSISSPALALPPQYGSQIDSIAKAKRGEVNRDYTVNGTVVTIYEHAFLLTDGTAQMLVHVGPHKTHELKISGGGILQVVGRMEGDIFRPMIISNPSGVIATFTSHDKSDSNLPYDEVINNTREHRFISHKMQREIENKKATEKEKN